MNNGHEESESMKGSCSTAAGSDASVVSRGNFNASSTSSTISTSQSEQTFTSEGCLEKEDALTVFCGASSGNDPVFLTAAEQVGKALALSKITLIYGGGSSGLMGAVAASALENGGKVHGVIPSAFLARGEQAKPEATKVPLSNKERNSTSEGASINGDSGVSKLIPGQTTSLAKKANPQQNNIETERNKETVVPSMHARKLIMSKSSNLGFLALPGGYGTLEELAEMTTWTQLGIHRKPVVLLNVNGFFTPLQDFINKAVESGFISELNRGFLTFVSDPNFIESPITRTELNTKASSNSPTESIVTPFPNAQSNGKRAEDIEKPHPDKHDFDWGKAGLQALREWEARGAGGGKPYQLDWN